MVGECAGRWRQAVRRSGPPPAGDGLRTAPAAALPRRRRQPLPRRDARRCAPVSAAPTGAPAPDSVHDAVVVGAGLSGLACALALHRAGLEVSVLEASDGVGGRVRTDSVDGFLLDRGFQIFLTAYPEARATLDYEALDLRPFYSGAMVWWNAAWHRVADPFRHPLDGVQSLLNPIGTVADKLRVGLLRLKLSGMAIGDILTGPETSIMEALKEEGFSDSIIGKFFRPFLGGIFFDNELGTSSRLFNFVMKMLSSGSNTLPARGIGALSDNLAGQLPPECIRTGSHVTACSGAADGALPSVQLSSGEVVTARMGVVVASEGPVAGKLLGAVLDASPSKASPGVGTCCLYFRAPSPPPNTENILYLNGEGTGLVNNCCFPSTVSPEYAPKGETLASVSVVGTQDELKDEQLEAGVRSQLSTWFGPKYVSTWKHIRTYRIPFCQPNQAPPTNFSRPVSLGSGLYVCGDHRDSATFDGALKSGRRAAEALLASK